MKKVMTLVIAFVCVLSLCSCGWNSQKAVATVFSENVTEVDVMYRGGSETASWRIEGASVRLLREWFNGLDYRHVEVQEGQNPGAVNGNEVYTFEFTGGEWSGFSYVINGVRDCYLLNPEGNWFFVTNPSYPPVTDPTK